jgi:hypothetical protein
MVGARTHVDRRRRCRPAACVASHPGTDAELSRPQSRGGTAAMAHAVGMPNGRWARTGDGLMVCRAPQRPGRPLRRVWRFAPRARRVWRAREVRASRRRIGVKARPNTCSTSPRSIRAAQRRAEAHDLRVQGFTFEVIGKHLGVSKAQAARDIDTALAEITVEPARELLKLELRRCEELMAAHFANACDGDVVATNTVLRVMAHRAMLMGWSRDQQGAVRVMISEGGGVGGEPPRRLELEFVLPGAMLKQRCFDTAPRICGTLADIANSVARPVNTTDSRRV